MGAAASAAKPKPQPEPSTTELLALPDPVQKGEDDWAFTCIPHSEELRKKADLMVFELSRLGFRLLRPGTDDCLLLFPWGQVHSWAQTETKFTFRYYDDMQKSVLSHVVYFKDTEPLMAQVKCIIDKILDERKAAAVGLDKMTKLVQALRQTSPDMQLGVIQVHASGGAYFWAEQGRQLVELLTTNFDKIEACTLLHSHLIDQNRFSYMLEALDCQADRDNVWHRITIAKKGAARAAKSALQ